MLDNLRTPATTTEQCVDVLVDGSGVGYMRLLPRDDSYPVYPNTAIARRMRTMRNIMNRQHILLLLDVPRSFWSFFMATPIRLWAVATSVSNSWINLQNFGRQGFTVFVFAWNNTLVSSLFVSIMYSVNISDYEGEGYWFCTLYAQLTPYLLPPQRLRVSPGQLSCHPGPRLVWFRNPTCIKIVREWPTHFLLVPFVEWHSLEFLFFV